MRDAMDSPKNYLVSGIGTKNARFTPARRLSSAGLLWHNVMSLNYSVSTRMKVYLIGKGSSATCININSHSYAPIKTMNC